jgi:hypothetical protein
MQAEIIQDYIIGDRNKDIYRSGLPSENVWLFIPNLITEFLLAMKTAIHLAWKWLRRIAAK